VIGFEDIHSVYTFLGGIETILEMQQVTLAHLWNYFDVDMAWIQQLPMIFIVIYLSAQINSRASFRVHL
jgi:hypothetical protein